MNRKVVLSIVAVLILTLVGIGIYRQVNMKQEKKVIKIGAILPLSGNLAFVGQFEKNSLEMALKGNKSVEIIYEDCKGSPKDAAIAASKLVNIDHVTAVISTLSFISESVNPILDQRKIPHFIFSFSPTLPSKNQNVFRYFVSSAGEANTFLDFITKSNYKKIVFLRHREPDAELVFNTFTLPNLEKMEVEVIDLPFGDNDFDFKNFAQKIKTIKPELVVVQAFAYKIPNILKAFKENKLSTPILGDLNFLDVDISDPNNKSLLQSIPFVGLAFQTDTACMNYYAYYQKIYNSKPFTFGVFAYDLGLIINNSIESETDFNVTNMPNLIKSTNGLIAIPSKLSNNELVVEYGIFFYQNDSLKIIN